MINLYYPQATPTPSDRTPRRPTDEHFWIWREQRRYEFMAAKLREAERHAYADLCDRWAEQARLEIAALEEVDRRIAALDRKLKSGGAA
jgi:hypothetical protein